MSATDRDSGLQPFDRVNAGVSDYVDLAVGGQAIEVQVSYGTVYAAKAYENSVHVVCRGPKGGHCWHRVWPRQDLENWLSKAVKYNPKIRRGPRGEVFPSGVIHGP